MKTLTLVTVICITSCTTTLNPTQTLQLQAEKSATVIYNHYNKRCLELTGDCSSRRDPRCLAMRICQRDRLEFGEKLHTLAEMFHSVSYLYGMELKRVVEKLEYEVSILDAHAQQIQTRK